MNAIRNLRLSARLLLTAAALTLALTISMVAGSATPASARSVAPAATPSANVDQASTGASSAIYLVVMIAGGGVAFSGRRAR